jgi:ankyrin repeat protein
MPILPLTLTPEKMFSLIKNYMQSLPNITDQEKQNNILNNIYDNLEDKTIKEKIIHRQDPVSGDTLLMTAIDAGIVAISNNLIFLGADVNAQNNEGLTPLILAVQNVKKIGEGKAIHIIQELLKKGADPNIKDATGKSAYDYALASGNDKIFGLLPPAPDHVDGGNRKSKKSRKSRKTRKSRKSRKSRKTRKSRK